MIAPAYKLLPFGTYKEAFYLIVPVYKKYAEENPSKKLIVMGDSAGGGLSLALTEQFKESGIRMPDELILLSPWVDISMENPDIPEYEAKDPWLFSAGLGVCARYWAGDNVTMFTGTNEMLYPDTVKSYGMLDESRSNELIVEKDMLHVYPLIPIPEAVPAVKKIVEKIMR